MLTFHNTILKYYYKATFLIIIVAFVLKDFSLLIIKLTSVLWDLGLYVIFDVYWLACSCLFHLETLKYWVAVQRVSLTSWGEGASLASVGHPSSDAITMKIWGICFITSTRLTPHLFLLGLLELILILFLDQLRLA